MSSLTRKERRQARLEKLQQRNSSTPSTTRTTARTATPMVNRTPSISSTGRACVTPLRLAPIMNTPQTSGKRPSDYLDSIEEDLHSSANTSTDSANCKENLSPMTLNLSAAHGCDTAASPVAAMSYNNNDNTVMKLTFVNDSLTPDMSSHDMVETKKQKIAAPPSDLEVVMEEEEPEEEEEEKQSPLSSSIEQPSKPEPVRLQQTQRHASLKDIQMQREQEIKAAQAERDMSDNKPQEKQKKRKKRSSRTSSSSSSQSSSSRSFNKNATSATQIMPRQKRVKTTSERRVAKPIYKEALENEKLMLEGLKKMENALKNQEKEKKLPSDSLVQVKLETVVHKAMLKLIQQNNPTNNDGLVEPEEIGEPKPLTRNLIISDASLPLMWFDNIGKGTYHIQAILNVGHQVLCTSPITCSATDDAQSVEFNESFEFKNVEPGFQLDVAIFATKTEAVQQQQVPGTPKHKMQDLMKTTPGKVRSMFGHALSKFHHSEKLTTPIKKVAPVCEVVQLGCVTFGRESMGNHSHQLTAICPQGLAPIDEKFHCTLSVEHTNSHADLSNCEGFLSFYEMPGATSSSKSITVTPSKQGKGKWVRSYTVLKGSKLAHYQSPKYEARNENPLYEIDFTQLFDHTAVSCDEIPRTICGRINSFAVYGSKREEILRLLPDYQKDKGAEDMHRWKFFINQCLVDLRTWGS